MVHIIYGVFDKSLWQLLSSGNHIVHS